MDVDSVTLSTRARAVGLSLKEWSRRSGIAVSTITRWRGGKLSPRLDTVRRLNEAVDDAEHAARPEEVAAE